MHRTKGMSIKNIENQPELDEVIGTTTGARHEDLSRSQPLVPYYCRTRHRAGSDNNCNRNDEYRGSVPQQNGRRANTGRPPIWGDQDADRLPPLRLVFRDQSSAQSNQSTSSRRQDRPVDLYDGSRLPTPCRQGRQPARIPRNDRRGGCGVQSQQPQRTCGPACPADRRATYDVQPPPCGDQNCRRGTYDVQPPPCGDQNSRRGTYDVSQPCPALQNGRRGTYDVSQPCPALQNGRRGTYDVSQPCPALQNVRRSSCNVRPPPAAASCGTPATPSNATFTMTGTLLLDGFQELSPVRQPPRDRSSSCGNRRRDNDSGISDFLGNQQNADMVAPRSMAAPGQPYVRIDESGPNTTPDNWRQMMLNRSSIGSAPMGIASPAYDDWRRNDDTAGGPTDASRLSRWSSSDRQSRPFGLEDSYAMSGASTPCDRPSRARSAAPECGLPVRKNRCRRDTFDRNTR